MDVRTFRAGSLQEALNCVRVELGPEATVLQTREVRGGWWGWARREIEVIASADIRAPARIPAVAHVAPDDPPPLVPDYRQEFRSERATPDRGPSVVAELCGEDDAVPTIAANQARALQQRTAEVRRSVVVPRRTRPEPAPAVLDLFSELLAAEFPESVARDLIERAQVGLATEDCQDYVVLRARLARLIEQELTTTGPLLVTPGRRRVVALVGPTGVGKTTTIAKLAAHYRLGEHRKVGLISVDTYRVAAVEQLRTYAEIIDLPLEVVTTPREMGLAVQRLAEHELILVDTAGRSPHDEVRIQELRALLHEAQADEVHLVLACGGSAGQLERTIERFAAADPTALLLTKLDETPVLGGLLPWLRRCGLPVSYLTNGQSVPQDIEPADRKKLARRLLGHD